MTRSALLVVALLVSGGLAAGQVQNCFGGGWTTGTTHAPGTGASRLLVVAVGGEAASQGASSFASVTYGGQPLTLFESVETSAAGVSYLGTLWYLKETGLQAATSSTIVVTPGGAGFVDTSIAAVTYCNVNQLNPIGATAAVQSSGVTTIDPITTSINVEAGNAGVAATGCGNASTYAWLQDVVERTDAAASSSTWSTADSVSYTTAGTKVAEADFLGNVNRNVILFAEIERFQPPPAADFGATPTVGIAPLTVAFTDLTSGPVTSWSWSFGDGGSSTQEDPSHTYTTTGTYTVALTASGPGGTDTETKPAFVVVQEPPPVAGFTGTPTSGVRPLTVTFTDASSGLVSSYAWSFGDSGTSSVANPTHTYANAGTFTVSLTVTGPGGSDTHTETDYVVVADAPPTAGFTGTPTSGVRPLTVAFTNTSSGVITGHAWSFGDSGTSNQVDPSHTYTLAGTYTVSLTVTGPGGSDTLTQVDYVTVLEPPPAADFSATPTSGTLPLTVTFSDATTGPVTAWSWSFGDGGTASVQNPTHVYPTAGTYTVSLQASGPGGIDTETKPGFITVNERTPVASFTGTPTGGPLPLSVAFTDASTGIITSHAWTFGDGDTSTLPSPTHVYDVAGVYTVALTVTGPGGTNTLTRTDYIEAFAPPVANFTGTPTSGVEPLSVAFSDASTGTVTAWSWTFGDGGTSTLPNPVHVYAAAGTYTVGLQVTGPGGSDLETKPNYVTVLDQPPVAEFTGSPTSGTQPLAVSFTDLSSGTVTAWAWTFGDGGTSTLPNPVHTYTTAGTYTVSLVATGPGGADTETKPGFVSVADQAPVADFAAAPTSGTLPLQVTFTDLSTGTVTAWAWSFGDTGTASVRNPVHTYTTAGTYTVVLTATGPGGSDVETKLNYVTVTEQPPVAEFTGSPTSGSFPLTVAFTDLSTGAVQTWSWSFGDGGSSTQENPFHTYTTPGTYTVSLTATGPGGTDTRVRPNYITVLEQPPVANFSGTPLTGIAPLTVAFTDLSSGVVTSHAWTFGDTGTSTLASPSHTYTSPGTYTVSLAATGPGGTDVETKLDYVVVTGLPPTAEFSGSPTIGLRPLTVGFTDLTAGTATTWAWSFGDGGTSNLQNPTHTYGSAGLFTVSLTASGPSGSDTEIKTNYVEVLEQPPVADFTATPTAGVEPLSVSFMDASTGAVNSRTWSFGDGGTSNLVNPFHTYTAPGTYTVSLTVSGPGGFDTETKTDFIVVSGSPPTANFTGAPLTGTAPLTVSFTDTSAGAVTSWSWSFGDAGSSTQQDPSHTYTSAGTFTVSLTATGPGGSDTETKPAYVTVNAAAVVAEFSGTPTTGTVPLAVSFTDASTGTPTAWAWNFGDGATSSVQDPTHVYTAVGTYTVSLQATGPGGTDLEVKADYVTVSPGPPAADFTAAPTSGTAPLTVAFTDLTTGTVTAWAWDFGDTSGSGLRNPTHVYSAVGTYSVSLTASGPGGSDTLTRTDYVVVSNDVLAEFSASPTVGGTPLTVVFTDLSTGGVTSWVWNFGDTNGSTLPNPTHTYLSQGTFTVTLTATGPTGTDSEVKVDYITAIGPTVADFTATPRTGTAPLSVAFTDLTTPPATSWVWSFGDGVQSTAQNPTHVYSTPGSYTVSLTATGPGGADTETKPNHVLVLVPAASSYRNGSGVNPAAYSAPAPIIGQTWTATVDPSAMPGTVATIIFVRALPLSGFPTVAGEILVDPAAFIADSIVISQGGLDQHVVPIPNDMALVGQTGYSQAMLYRTTVQQFTNAADITPGFEPQESPPVAALAGGPVAGVAPLSVSFSDTSTGTVTGWTWSFGDGGGSSLQNPTHTFTSEGTYSVSLVVEGPGGFDLVYASDYVVVQEPPAAQFDAGPQAGAAPLAVAFDDLSTGTVTSWAWDFGDGGTSSLRHPSHVYMLSGTYTVSLTASGPVGSDTETKPGFIVVGNTPPVADFAGTPQVGAAPLLVAFNDLSTGAVTSWSWDFGDGGASTLRHPSHTYTAMGTYTVTLTATGPGGSDSETKLDYVTVTISPPQAAFSGTPLVGTQPLTVAFTDESTGGVSSWAWTFGDGATSSVPDPTHTYVLFGTYTVSLTTSGPGGTDTETKPGYVMVLPPPPVPDFGAAPTSGVAPLLVSFTDATVGLVSSWLWEFGDGATSNQQHPTHSYTAPGTFTVSLTATGAGGSATETKTDLVTVLAGAFADGDFESQTAGASPTFPWLVTGGAGHVIQPDGGVSSDGGMPASGVQWAEVSAAGTTAATPPSNPGGAGSPPVGTAGFQQTFAFDPAAPVLVFSAAFVLGGPAASAIENDFMSVDVSDGSTHWNLYYADTFSSFPLTSARHGLPMTEVTESGFDLSQLFPSATAGTPITVAVRAGNAGNGAAPSLGYVDDFFLRNVASITYRNGTGLNPPCYVADPPVIGTVWNGRVDHRDRPGTTFTVITVQTMAITGSPVPGFGEPLVAGTEVFQFVAVPDPSGITTHNFTVPLALDFVGMGPSQALIVGTPADNTFCNALDLVVGFAPPVPPPAADFGASTTSGAAPLTVLFTDTSAGSLTSWNWEFGDGDTSTQASPGHVYSTPGTYTVTLRTTGPGGLDIERKFDLIQVQ